MQLSELIRHLHNAHEALGDVDVAVLDPFGALEVVEGAADPRTGTDFTGDFAVMAQTYQLSPSDSIEIVILMPHPASLVMDDEMRAKTKLFV